MVLPSQISIGKFSDPHAHSELVEAIPGRGRLQFHEFDGDASQT